jgi:prepilin-type N-terminal cleavage/methylation domain-containing protein
MKTEPAAVKPENGAPEPGGFTLIELLVVISIIAVLASLLLPVLSRGKRSAQGIACLSNLHQIGIALDLYLQDHESRLPVCPKLPSVAATNETPITVVLEPYLQAKRIHECPADRTFFPVEQTSYEWNNFLNGASYDRPEDWSPATKALVEVFFNGRLNTPITGDAGEFHVKQGNYTGKNALFFDGRVEKAKVF